MQEQQVPDAFMPDTVRANQIKAANELLNDMYGNNVVSYEDTIRQIMENGVTREDAEAKLHAPPKPPVVVDELIAPPLEGQVAYGWAVEHEVYRIWNCQRGVFDRKIVTQE